MNRYFVINNISYHQLQWQYQWVTIDRMYDLYVNYVGEYSYKRNLTRNKKKICNKRKLFNCNKSVAHFTLNRNLKRRMEQYCFINPMINSADKIGYNNTIKTIQPLSLTNDDSKINQKPENNNLPDKSIELLTDGQKQYINSTNKSIELLINQQKHIDNLQKQMLKEQQYTNSTEKSIESLISQQKQMLEDQQDSNLTNKSIKLLINQQKQILENKLNGEKYIQADKLKPNIDLMDQLIELLINQQKQIGNLQKQIENLQKQILEDKLTRQKEINKILIEIKH